MVTNIMNRSFVFSLMLLGLVNSLYIPESGDDWTLLKPQSGKLAGSFDTLPFEIGIVANDYVIDENGEYHEPSRTLTAVTTTVTTITTVKSTSTGNPAVQIQDGQVQKHRSSTEKQEINLLTRNLFSWDIPKHNRQKSSQARDFGLEEPDQPFVSPVHAVACLSDTTLRMNLTNNILRDSSQRIGSIVSGHQFQFDGPLPQYGAIYASGWSVTNKGQLALGNSTKFYQCASGDFYNLYAKSIAPQCHPVSLDVVELIAC